MQWVWLLVYGILMSKILWYQCTLNKIQIATKIPTSTAQFCAYYTRRYLHTQKNERKIQISNNFARQTVCAELNLENLSTVCPRRPVQFLQQKNGQEFLDEYIDKINGHEETGRKVLLFFNCRKFDLIKP